MQAKKTADQIKKINDGLDAIKALGSVVGLSGNKEIIAEWEKVNSLAKMLEALHVDISKVRNKKGIEAVDEGLKRSLKIQKRIFEFQQKLSTASQSVEEQVSKVSPKGAARLTAQSMGMMLEAQGKILASQRVQIDLMMQQQMLENYERKIRAQHITQNIDELSKLLSTSKVEFKFPRWN